MQDPKSRQKLPSGHHRTTLSSYIFATKAHTDNRKKNLWSSNMSFRCRLNIGPLTAENDWRVWGTPIIFQRVSRLGSVTARQSSSGRQPNCGVEQRAPPMFGRATVTLGIGPHSSSWYFSNILKVPQVLKWHIALYSHKCNVMYLNMTLSQLLVYQRIVQADNDRVRSINGLAPSSVADDGVPAFAVFVHGFFLIYLPQLCDKNDQIL